MNFTKHNLKKVEDLLQSQGYIVRYEKGNFQSGYCIVENRNIAIVNKFYDTEARINTLIDILMTISIEEALMDDKQKSLYQKIQKMVNLEEEEQATEE